MQAWPAYCLFQQTFNVQGFDPVNTELLPLLGVEGIVIFSLIVLLSFVLAGFRLPLAEGNGRRPDGSSTGPLLRVRQRLPTRPLAQLRAPVRRHQQAVAFEVAGWIIAAGRIWAAKARANQSKINSSHSACGRVKAQRPLRPVQSVDDSDFVVDGRASVSENEPQLMDSDTQWTRVNRIVNEGLGRARQIETLHEAAARQLDAVDYAYERMLVELRDVLPQVAQNRSTCRSNRDDAYAEASREAIEAVPVDAPVTEVAKSVSERSAKVVSQPSSAPAGRTRKRKDPPKKATESEAA